MIQKLRSQICKSFRSFFTDGTEFLLCFLGKGLALCFINILHPLKRIFAVVYPRITHLLYHTSEEATKFSTPWTRGNSFVGLLEICIQC
jgi:hypothetical protein